MSDIAKEIIRQLGGLQFRVMTGAKNFLSEKSCLYFSVPGTLTKNGINRVRIALEADDTYTIDFMKMRAGALKTLKHVEMVYNDNLRQIFELETGLVTKL